jgi:TolB-like protein
MSQVALVKTSLSAILRSGDFAASRRMSDFLTYVVEETLAGRGSRIKAYSVAIDVLGRRPDFDPQKDPSVRAQAARLRRALERFYLTRREYHPVVIDIPKGGYVPSFQFLEPPALSRTPGEDTQERSKCTSRPSVTVMVLDNHTMNPEYDHFASGLTQELVVRLSRFHSLLVVGPVSASRLETIPGRSPASTRSGQTHFTLSGSLRSSDGKLRMSVQLTKHASGENLWAESNDFAMDANQILSLEDQLADRVVSAIGGEYGIIMQALTQDTYTKDPANMEDYEAALLNYHWSTVLTEEAFSRALEALEASARKFPKSALNLALLADIYCVDYFSHLGRVRDNLQQALELTTRAQHVNPRLQEACWAMGEVRFLTRELAECRQEFSKAVELNPYNPNTLAMAGLFLAMLGDWDAAIAMTHEALQRNPHHPGWYPFVPALYHLRAKDYESALYEAEALNTPGLLWGALVRAAAHGYQGNKGKALAEAQNLHALQPAFAKNPAAILEPLLYSTENIDLLINGLDLGKRSGIRPVARRRLSPNKK